MVGKYLWWKKIIFLGEKYFHEKRNIWLRISLFGEKIFDARQIWQEEIFDGKYESIKVWLIPCQQKLRLSIGDGDGDWWWWSSSSAGSSSLCKNSPPWLRLWFFIAQPFSWSAAFQIICFFISKKITSYGKIPSFIGSWYKVLLSPETTSHTDLVLTLERKPGWQGRQICIKSKYKYKVIWFWHIYIKYKYKDLKVTSFLPHMHKRNHSFATREREPDERTSGSFTDSYEENMEVPIPYHRYKIPCQYHRYQSIPYHRYGLKNLCQNSMYTTLLCNAHTIGRIFFWSTKCVL